MNRFIPGGFEPGTHKYTQDLKQKVERKNEKIDQADIQLQERNSKTKVLPQNLIRK